MLNNKSILITGGTGTFGKAFVKTIIERFPAVTRLVVFSPHFSACFTAQLTLV